jgi:hypothetical protein
MEKRHALFMDTQEPRIRQYANMEKPRYQTNPLLPSRLWIVRGAMEFKASKLKAKPLIALRQFFDNLIWQYCLAHALRVRLLAQI